jgi:hypothetical protein
LIEPARARTLREIVIELHPQPSVGGAPDRLLKPQRHFGRNTGLAANDAVELLACHAQTCGCLGDAEAQRALHKKAILHKKGRRLHKNP